jgi:hypothetical protein
MSLNFRSSLDLDRAGDIATQVMQSTKSPPIVPYSLPAEARQGKFNRVWPTYSLNGPRRQVFSPGAMNDVPTIGSHLLGDRRAC